MSKVRIEIHIEFSGEGQEREPMYLDMTLSRENPSDAYICDEIANAVIEHVENNPRDEVAS
ncbi:hypothetical protein [Pseudomonas petrae]|uniref:hypothetical protein n=1 Tax=Pseudomonas petrae TaxID=2912190 RepID=UPI001F37D197|nr:hypothetical protein [Pseudomonas petrae]MCF7536178.1 hypothetical protein [Pseudomonas petrae]